MVNGAQHIEVTQQRMEYWTLLSFAIPQYLISSASFFWWLSLSTVFDLLHAKLHQDALQIYPTYIVFGTTPGLQSSRVKGTSSFQHAIQPAREKGDKKDPKKEI
jgi:hypothetical protein